MTALNTQGPGCNYGPGCCCDPCLTDHIDCLGECCRCVPKVFELIFTPDNDLQCSRFALFMHHEGLGTYRAALDGLFGYASTELLITLYRDQYLNECSWRLSIADLGIDDFILIDRTYVTCQSPTFSIAINTGSCSGTITITRYELSQVPFVAVAHEMLGPCINTATWELNVVPSADCTGPGCNYVGVSDPSAPMGLSWQLASGSCDAPCACQPDGFTGFPRLPDFVGDTLSVACPGFSDPGVEWLPVSESNASCCTPSEPESLAGSDGDIQTTNCTGTALGVIFPNACGICTEVCGIICVEYTYGGVTHRNQYEWNSSTNRWIHEFNHITDYISLTEDEYGNCVLLPVIAELEDALVEFDPYDMTICASGLDIIVPSVDQSVSVSISCNPCTCWDWICNHCRCACNRLCLLIYQDGVLDLMELPWFFDLANNTAGWTDGYMTVTLTKDPYNNNCVITVPGFDPFEIESCGEGIQFSLQSTDGYDVAFGACKKGLCFAPPATCCDRAISDLPLMLVATIVSTELCGCAGATVNLIWNPFAEWWRGRGSLGGCYYDSEIQITVHCGEYVGGTVDYIICGTDGAGGQLLYDGPPVANGPVTCDPISFTLGSVTIDRSCCDDEPMAGGTIEITITE